MNIVTWNAERMFSHGGGNMRATPEDAIKTLQTLNADVVAIPEFAFKSSLKQATLDAIALLGYQVVTVEYADERASGLLFAMLSRVDIKDSIIHQFENSERFAVELRVRYHEDVLSIIGTHLDDRSEVQRRHEAECAINIIANIKHQVVFLGDMNALHGEAWQARLLRLWPVRLLAKLSPSRDGYSIGERLVEMASGGTIAAIQAQTSLVNATSLRPTISAKQIGLEWAPSSALVKIDWIFVSKTVQVIDDNVFPDVGSDHRPLLVIIK